MSHWHRPAGTELLKRVRKHRARTATCPVCGRTFAPWANGRGDLDRSACSATCRETLQRTQPCAHRLPATTPQTASPSSKPSPHAA